jgi:ribonuclease HI
LNLKSERIGIGIVIRDQQGNVKAAQSSVRRGRLDPTTAETVAVVQTLRFCKEIGLAKIYLEGYAKNVVDALLSLEANWSKSGHIIAEAQLLLQDFIYWEIKYVSREANFAAHNLAKLAAILGLERQWMDEIPDFISEIIRGEQVSLPH